MALIITVYKTITHEKSGKKYEAVTAAKIGFSTERWKKGHSSTRKWLQSASNKGIYGDFKQIWTFTEWFGKKNIDET